MRVALISTAAPGSLGSMATYALMVQKALQTHVPQVEAVAACVLPSARGAQSRLPGRLALLKQVIQAREWARNIRADVYHVLDASHAYMADTLPASRTVVTVHDLIPSLQAMGRFPVNKPGRAARWLIGRSLRFVRHAGAIATVSQCTANDLAEIAGRQADAVIHLPLRSASGASTKAQVSARSTLESVARRPDQVLHVGNNGFYKNRAGVLKIFAAMRARQPNLHLTMAGPAPDAVQRGLLESLGLQSSVHYDVNPSDGDIEHLYQHSGVLLFPSLYEGYGWPPLEALQQGCPVVCADRGSLPEVVGDAALLADPADTEQFALQALRVLNEPELAAALLERARARLAALTLERMASQLLPLYRKVAGRS